FSDWVMADLGPRLVPGGEEIGRRLVERRAQRTPWERAILRLTGLDLKLEQYRAGERFVGTFTPQRLFYRTQEQPMHHVAIRSSLREDLYIILSEWDTDGRAQLRVLVHPLVSWLWAGGLILVLGVVVAVLPETWRRMAPAPISPQPAPPLSAEGAPGGP
ncbi:MAG: zinc-dependent metalloprotease, partial [Firmicutes bacterium]|nr:zinc-dependent metalloprotease [Bacillota bacterium]